MRAGTSVQCAYRGEVVPCELIPTSIADSVERKAMLYEKELARHDATLSMLSAATRASHECSGQLRATSSQLELAQQSLRDRTPTWVWWSIVGLASAAALGGGVYLGTLLP